MFHDSLPECIHNPYVIAFIAELFCIDLVFTVNDIETMRKDSQSKLHQHPLRDILISSYFERNSEDGTTPTLYVYPHGKALHAIYAAGASWATLEKDLDMLEVDVASFAFNTRVAELFPAFTLQQMTDNYAAALT